MFSLFFLSETKELLMSDICKQKTSTGQRVYIYMCCYFASQRIDVSPPPAQDVKSVCSVLRKMRSRFTSAENTHRHTDALSLMHHRICYNPTKLLFFFLSHNYHN